MDLTLFSLILILGVYYITLPSEFFLHEGVEKVSKNIDVNVSEVVFNTAEQENILSITR